MDVLASASSVLLFGAIAAYVFSYYLYRQRYFWLVATGWALNLTYILLTTFGSSGSFINAQNVAFLAGLMPTVAFTFALGELPNREWPRRTTVVVVFTILLISVTPLLNRLDQAVPSSFYPGALTSFAVIVGLGWSLLRLSPRDTLLLLRGKATLWRPQLRVGANDLQPADREDQEFALPQPVVRNLTLARRTFGYSFIAYGFMQLLYPASHSFDQASVLAIYWFAFATKGLNLLGLPLLLLADFRHVTELSRLKSLAEELGVFAASLEHDVRNPVAVIKNKIKFLRTRYQHDGYLTNELKAVEHHLNRIREAVGVIPALRESHEYYVKRFQRWNLLDLARTAVTAVRTAGEHSFKAEVLPEKSRITVRCYRERFVEAVVNILNNGIEAAEQAGRAPHVQLQCFEDTVLRQAGLKITDNGVGVNRESIAHLTRPFFSTKNHIESARTNRGLGLFIASRIVTQHQGQIHFESDASTHTTVTITLPIDTEDHGDGE